jgi:hypothetical protein
VVLGTTSGSTGSSIVTREGGGTALASVGGSSSSLHRRYKLRKQRKNKAIEKFDYNTYDASIS